MIAWVLIAADSPSAKLRNHMDGCDRYRFTNCEGRDRGHVCRNWHCCGVTSGLGGRRGRRAGLNAFIDRNFFRW